MREDRSIHTFAFSDSRERLLEVKKKFMKELPQQKNLDGRTEQIRDIYLSCMNAPAKAKDEKAVVKRITEEIAKIKTPEELIRYSNANIGRGLGTMTSLWSTNNLDDPKKMDAMLYSSFMLLPDHKYYEQADLMKRV